MTDVTPVLIVADEDGEQDTKAIVAGKVGIMVLDIKATIPDHELLKAVCSGMEIEVDTIRKPRLVAKIEDQEAGLASDFAPSDVANLIHDKSHGDHESYKALRFPDRVGTNYPKGDALSCYKILPKQ